MNGIYIHIPFCRKACRYCDFFFSVSLRFKEDFLKALKREINSGRQFNDRDEVVSVYFGGGTPSVLHPDEILSILEDLGRVFRISSQPEITLEANPDDLNKEYLKTLKKTGVNRLSVGIQSFEDNHLELMRRSHNSVKARESIENALNEGFSNINCDLIYGIPGLSNAGWNKNLDEIFMLNISHLSAYHLTFEPGTVFDHWRKKGRLMVPEEEESLRQYDLLRQKAAEAGFEHYEISNFARNENYSQHNLLYWTGGKYLGFGPSAHSFDGNSRSWNISSLAGYINDAGREDRISEKEILTGEERYHDYLITALRTNKGADLQHIKVQLGEKYYDWFIKKAETFIKSGELIKEGTKIKMTGNSWFVADHILRALFLE